MLIVNVDKIEFFKRAMQYMIFKKCYSKEFNFFDEKSPFDQDYKYINAYITKTGEKVAIFLFHKPDYKLISTFKDSKIIVFYNPDAVVKTIDNLFETRELSDDYFEEYNNQIKLNFNIFDGIRLFSTNDNQSYDLLYKYYSNDMKEERKILVDSGQLSFVNPYLFNDPFDCDYDNKILGEDKNKFRVLCLIPKFDNILMWSYYGNEHKGFCYGYNKNQILRQLEKKYKGICFVGKVNYEKKTP